MKITALIEANTCSKPRQFKIENICECSMTEGFDRRTEQLAAKDAYFDFRIERLTKRLDGILC